MSVLINNNNHNNDSKLLLNLKFIASNIVFPISAFGFYFVPFASNFDACKHVDLIEDAINLFGAAQQSARAISPDACVLIAI